MNKLIVFAFAILMSAGAWAQAQSKVGTIDVEVILGKMTELKSVQDGVQAYGEELDAELGKKLASYDSLIKNYQDMQATWGENIRTTKQNEIIQLENEMAQFRDNSVSLLQIRQNELMAPLYSKIGQALDVVAKREQYTQVIAVNPALAFLDKNFDLTEAVMKELGIPLE